MNATIVCGNTIGKYAMVAAGAVVTKDVPDYALVAGVPARVDGKGNGIKRMKILFLSAANSVHTVRWVNAFAERGHKVVLVSQADHPAELGNTISKKVKILYLPVKGTKGYYLNAAVLRNIYKKNGADVINAHYASGYGTLARMARLPHVLLSVWGSDVYDFPYESKIKEYILRKNLAYADVIASTSISMGGQTRKFLKADKNIEITPFGVDTRKFAPARKETGSGKIVFGIVKALSKKYGVSTVIEAFALFLDKLPAELKKTAVLEIYGKGDQLDELKALAVRKGIRERVFFRGCIPNSEVPDAMRNMDIFLLGSESESFGVAAVEAMACGLPVIATGVSGFREVVKDRETGFLVPVNDAQSMSEKMLELYGSETLRKKMGEKGRKRVERLYDWEDCVEKMLKVYRQMKKNA